MTEIPAPYGDPSKIAQTRLARVQTALGCETWYDLARLLNIPLSIFDHNADAAFPPVPAPDAPILRNILRCLPTGRLREELKAREEHGEDVRF